MEAAEHENDTLAPRDMRQWLEGEIRGVLKATELRIKDATDFVTKYATGEISEEQMSERHSAYSRRWGDAIPGVTADESLTNERIIALLDENSLNTPQEMVGKILAKGKGSGHKR